MTVCEGLNPLGKENRECKGNNLGNSERARQVVIPYAVLNLRKLHLSAVGEIQESTQFIMQNSIKAQELVARRGCISVCVCVCVNWS